MNGDAEYVDNGNGDIPRWLKWTFIAINRVGFPIVAFGLMYYMCETAVKANTEAISANTIILMQVRDSLNRFGR